MILDRIDPTLVTSADCRYGHMMYLSNDRYIGAALARYGEYSESEVAMWRDLLEPNALAADVGANLGAHTVALASLVPQGMVFAFEPLWYLHALALGNVARNGHANVRTFHAAAGAEPGQLTIPAMDYTIQGEHANYGGMSMLGHATGNQVQVLRLDDVCQRLDFIKVDVEGMEWQVLQGAQRIIEQHTPILYVENNPEAGRPDLISEQQTRLIDQIQELGYDCWWHHALLYNPDNYRHAAPQNDQERFVASFNMICLPIHADNVTALGCTPIARGE